MYSVLFVNPYYHPYLGGVEKAIDNISLNLFKCGLVNKISLLTTYSQYPTGYYSVPSEEIFRDVSIYRLNFFPKNIPGLYHSYNGGLFSANLFHTLDKINPNIVHYCKTEWFIPNHFIFQYLRNRAKHIFFSSYHPKKLVFKHFPMVVFNKYLLRNMDGIHVPSHALAKGISKTFDIDLRRISVISLGVEKTTVSRKAREKRGVTTLLIVGRFSKVKGQLDFLQALLKYGGEALKKISLILIGKDAGELAALQTFIKVNKLSFVEIYTDIDDVALKNFYLKSDIFISPSLYEAFGLAVVEAMSFGLPVIAFDQGALREVTENTTILVEYLNWEIFIREIINLIGSPTDRFVLGEKSRNFVIKKYSWENTAQMIANLYDRVFS